MLISVKLAPTYDYPVLAEFWRAADQLGFHGIWDYDHFYGLVDQQQPTYEGWTTLAAMAAQTTNARVGIRSEGFGAFTNISCQRDNGNCGENKHPYRAPVKYLSQISQGESCQYQYNWFMPDICDNLIQYLGSLSKSGLEYTSWSLVWYDYF